jgi:hypothetical protein
VRLRTRTAKLTAARGPSRAARRSPNIAPTIMATTATASAGEVETFAPVSAAVEIEGHEDLGHPRVASERADAVAEAAVDFSLTGTGTDIDQVRRFEVITVTVAESLLPAPHRCAAHIASVSGSPRLLAPRETARCRLCRITSQASASSHPRALSSWTICARLAGDSGDSSFTMAKRASRTPELGRVLLVRAGRLR